MSRATFLVVACGRSRALSPCFSQRRAVSRADRTDRSKSSRRVVAGPGAGAGAAGSQVMGVDSPRKRGSKPIRS